MHQSIVYCYSLYITVEFLVPALPFTSATCTHYVNKNILFNKKYLTAKIFKTFCFRSADTEAPDQRTRYLRKKKNKKKKKRKKVADDTSAANISNESIEEDKTEPIEEGKPITLISCTSGNCEKKERDNGGYIRLIVLCNKGLSSMKLLL